MSILPIVPNCKCLITMTVGDLDLVIDSLRDSEALFHLNKEGQKRKQGLYQGLCQLRVASFGERE